MKKYSFLLLVLLVSTFALAQKNEKIKGSKKVTIERKEIGFFDTLEVSDNIEVYLTKGDQNEIKIEADDNLQEFIRVNLISRTLQISTSKNITSFKKLIARVTYTNDFKLVVSKNEAIINAIQEIQLSEITFNSFDDSKLNLNINSKKFVLQADNNSKTQLTLKSDKATIALSKNAVLKAQIASSDLKCDLYQKSQATLEGDSENAIIRLDNSARFTGNKFALATAELITEGSSECSIKVKNGLSIAASGNSKIQLHGDQKVYLKLFKDNAILSKK